MTLFSNQKFLTMLGVSTAMTMIACSPEQAGQTPAPTAKTGTEDTSQQAEPATTSIENTGAPFIAGEVSVPAGFSISMFHNGVGQRARQIAVRDNGDVFVARMDGTLFALRDTNQDGKADIVEEKKLPITTGVDIHKDWLYFSDRVSLNRLKLDDNLLPQGEIETIVAGFPPEKQHAEKTFTLDEEGHVYINSGAPSNACQERSRTPGSSGLNPCPQLERYAGIWQFDANTPNQDAANGTLFVTGVRNAMALAWSNEQNGLFIANHGRDQLSALWPDYFTDAQSAELPAEEFHFAKQGADLGWPYTYFDPSDNTRYLAPEYGGDGKKTPDTDYQQPLYGFPAHWAPNDIILLNSDALPAPYNKGALIAFHGSWNRAPLPQAGYRVSFMPMENGAPSGAPMNFAVGFPLKDPIVSPGDAEHRPMGLAQGADGAIYISDSVKGTIWKVTPDTE